MHGHVMHAQANVMHAHIMHDHVIQAQCH
jgi:hypothetical protein